MALRNGIQRNSQALIHGNFINLSTRFNHSLALSPSFSNSISSPPLSLPYNHLQTPHFSFQFPGFAPGCGPMDLMAVPKKKVSRHKRAIRNGPKALKPTPVIIRCKSCGRVKLPHFYCCSGRIEDPGERSDATN